VHDYNGGIQPSGLFPPTDPAAFLGNIATAGSTGVFSGSQLGFSFRSTSATTDRGYAQLGRERNGSFL
jgi:hypothetical protein